MALDAGLHQIGQLITVSSHPAISGPRQRQLALHVAARKTAVSIQVRFPSTRIAAAHAMASSIQFAACNEQPALEAVKHSRVGQPDKSLLELFDMRNTEFNGLAIISVPLKSAADHKENTFEGTQNDDTIWQYRRLQCARPSINQPWRRGEISAFEGRI